MLLVGNSVGNMFSFVWSHKKMGNKEKVLSRLCFIKNQIDLNSRRGFSYRFHINNYYFNEYEKKEIISAETFLGKGRATIWHLLITILSDHQVTTQE